MKWIKCIDRMPQQMGIYAVFIQTPATPDFGILKGCSASESIELSSCKEKLTYHSQDDKTITYKREMCFFSKSLFSDSSYEIKDVTHWLEVTPPEEK